MEFDFSRYSKIVANDLSLNGSISSALGGFSQWSSSGNDIYYNDGKVGIGTTTPGSKLDVDGAVFVRNQTLTFATGGGGGTRTEEVALVFNQAGNNRTLALKTDSDASLYGTTGGGGGSAVNWCLGPYTNYYFNDANVGIGTTSPNEKLHIKGNDDEYVVLEFEGRRSSGNRLDRKAFIGVGATGGNYGTDMYFRIRNSNDATVTWDTNSQNVLYMNGSITHLYTGNTERMTINSSGYVGIGTTSPLAPIHVQGSSSAETSINGRYFTGGHGVTGLRHLGVYSVSDQISIRSNGTIYSAAAIAASDSRIKENMVEINDTTALDKLRLLKPTTYNYIDKIHRHDQQVEGFIAQEVKEVIPYAVSVITDTIPNIYKMGTYDSSNQYINIPEYNTSLLEKDASGNIYKKLKIYDASDNKYEIEIKNIVSTNEFEVESSEIIPNELFVYGQEVEDFHTLKKEQIFTVTTAALQEVDRQLQAEKTKVATLESENATLKTQVTDILTRLSALENN